MNTPQAGKDRIDEASRAVVLRDANRREKAEAEEHFREPQLIGDEHFDFADARDLAADIAALVRRERAAAFESAAKAVCLDCKDGIGFLRPGVHESVDFGELDCEAANLRALAAQERARGQEGA